MKQPAFLTVTPALGDLICSTPTLRKLSEVYGSKVVAISNNPKALENLPYVDKSLHIGEVSEDDLRKDYDLSKSFHMLGKQDNLGIEFKHAICDIRQFHAKDLGFMLKPEELTCDYIPSEGNICLSSLGPIPEEYVVVHPVKSWESRTWEKEKWQKLVSGLNDKGIPVVCVGRDSGESSDQGKLDKPAYALNVSVGVDLTNMTSMDQTWHLLNGAKAVITMDSGILHMAGTTETYIIQLGSNIDPFFRAPYRHGRQDYRYSYILGTCPIHCASDMVYSLRDWGGIQNVTLIDTCLEQDKNFQCKPDVEKVLDKAIEVFDTEDTIISTNHLSVDQKQDPRVDIIENSEVIKIASGSLGDTIGSLAVIEQYRKESGKNISVIAKLDGEYFRESYPELKILPHGIEPRYQSQGNFYKIADKGYLEYRKIFYKFDQPLIQGYADQLGVSKWERPKIDLFKGDRPIKSKYACFSMHSTAQSKHWNYPGGWEKLCRMLRKSGITPVCIDVHGSFGIEGHWNKVPGPALKKQGMDLKEMSNFIHHSEFFIGISSGLSWVAHALGKKVVMISGVTSEDNEFEEDTIRIINKNVCHGCINKPEITFDPGDWLWCPLHKGTDRQFECSKTITPEEVFDVIERNLL
jgi:autotransporter strand-loop-strand O-heptosyltransferase